MIAANLFDHPAVLLLIVFIALVRWLISKAKTQAQDTQSPMAPPPVEPITRGSETQTEEERIRKFLEALGQPAGTPPPKVTPRPRPVAPKIFPRLPPLRTKPPPLPPDPSIPGATPPPLPVERVGLQPPAALEAGFEVREVARQTSSEPSAEIRRSAAISIGQRIKLGTPEDLRSAIILREVFGPPRSLQPLDLTRGV